MTTKAYSYVSSELDSQEPVNHYHDHLIIQPNDINLGEPYYIDTDN